MEPSESYHNPGTSASSTLKLAECRNETCPPPSRKLSCPPPMQPSYWPKATEESKQNDSLAGVILNRLPIIPKPNKINPSGTKTTSLSTTLLS